MKNKKYIFIFVGIDGSGKTTQAKRLVAHLKERFPDRRVFYVWNRWNPFFLRPAIMIWKKIAFRSYTADQAYREKENKKKGLLKNRFLRTLWKNFFIVDYIVQTFLKVKMRLLCADVMVLDRSFYDSLIDQGINFGLTIDELTALCTSGRFIRLFYKPDLVFFIDVSESIALTRTSGVTKAYLEERRTIYTSLSKTMNWHLIDSARPIESMEQEILQKVLEALS